MTDFPPDLTYGWVAGRLLRASADTDDAGRTPDPIAPDMTVTISALQAFRRTELSEPTTILPDDIVCGVDLDGYIVDPMGERAIQLVTGAYRVSYQEPNGYLQISSHDIVVAEEHTEASPLSLTRTQQGSGRLIPSQYADLASQIAGFTAQAAGVPFDYTKNLANPDDFMPGYVVGASGPSPSPLYTATGFIPVAAGQTYTLSNPRNVYAYDADKTWLGTGTGLWDNPTNQALTITAPAGAAYLRASLVTADYLHNFQVEKGPSATPFEAYGVRIPNLIIGGGAGSLHVERDGTALSITTDLGGQELVQTADLAGSKNGAFSWSETRLAGTRAHIVNDSITPLRTQIGTIGANHGVQWVRRYNNPDGKTAADLGSTWTDGAKTYTLLAFEGDLPVIGGPPTVTTLAGTEYNSTDAVPATNLTHVAGATHTGTLTSAGSALTQLYPSTGRVKVAATLDGAPLTDGTSSGNVLRIAETYDILDYTDLVAKMQTNPGTPVTGLDIDGAIRMSVLYEMRAPGSWMISSTTTALQPQFLYRCGYLQAEALEAPSGGSTWRWVPGVKPIDGFDFHNGVQVGTYASSIMVTPADCMDPAKPPTWSLDVARDSGGNDVLGFALGYIPDKTNGSWVARTTNGATQLWDIRSNNKNYPVVDSSEALTTGQRVVVQGFRAYLPPGDDGFAVQDAQAGYAFALASGASARPVPLPEQMGRTIDPLAEQGLTVAPGVVDADGLTVTGTGHAIAKLT